MPVNLFSGPSDALVNASGIGNHHESKDDSNGMNARGWVPYECICGFTAGSSFAWAKHLALRDTPNSSIRHSRVIRAGGRTNTKGNTRDGENAICADKACGSHEGIMEQGNNSECTYDEECSVGGGSYASDLSLPEKLDYFFSDELLSEALAEGKGANNERLFLLHADESIFSSHNFIQEQNGVKAETRQEMQALAEKKMQILFGSMHEFSPRTAIQTPQTEETTARSKDVYADDTDVGGARGKDVVHKNVNHLFSSFDIRTRNLLKDNDPNDHFESFCRRIQASTEALYRGPQDFLRTSAPSRSSSESSRPSGAHSVKSCIPHGSLGMNDIVMWADWRKHLPHLHWHITHESVNISKRSHSLSKPAAERISPIRREHSLIRKFSLRKSFSTRSETSKDSLNAIQRSMSQKQQPYNPLEPLESFKRIMTPSWNLRDAHESRIAATLAEGGCSTSLIPQEGDMTWEDLFSTHETSGRDVNMTNSSPINAQSSLSGVPNIDKTELHDICRKGALAKLLVYLKSPPLVLSRVTRDHRRQKIQIIPTEQVGICTEAGQLPIHFAALHRSEVQDLGHIVIEAAYQPAPGIVTTLLTGRNPTNGELLFEVDRDERGRCRQCLHQDSLGMTPLHVAAMSHSTAALDIVCRLLEANSLAAGVHDLDGFLPLDLALRNPSRGSSSIVKVLLRAYPRAALVEASDSLDEDWVLAFDKLQPVGDDEMDEGFQPEKGRHEVSFEHLQNARDLRFEKHVWPPKHSKSMTNFKLRSQKSKLDPGLAHFKSMTDLRSKLDPGHETCQDECAVKHKLSQSLMDLLLSDIPDGHAETREIGVASSKVDYYPVHKDLSYLTPQKLGVQQLLLELSACYRPGNISVGGQTQIESFSLQDKLAADKVKRSRTILEHRDHSSNEIMRDIQTAIQNKQFRLHESLNTAWLSFAEMLLASEELDTSKKPCILKNIIAKFLGKLKLKYNSQICAQKLQEVLSENGICCQYSMAENLVLGADVDKKGYLTLSEFEDASLRACRFWCMGIHLVDRWEKDRNYVDCSGLDVEGTFKNLETEQDVNRDVFAKVVENCRLDNLDTRRRPPGRKRYTWSGMPMLEETDTFMEQRPKTIKVQQLLEKMTKPSSDARFRRRPLHYCCANSLHPEAAVMLRDVLAACERAAQVKDENGRLPLHLACMNESYTSCTMVRLLIEKYPEAAKIKDKDGYLPLHLCLLHNQGDAALDIVSLLLRCYPRAAAVRCGAQIFDEENLAIYLALKNTSVFADKIVSKLLDAYPETLFIRDHSGANLLHRFCWIKHPCPDEVHKALETERGICKWLRAPAMQKEQGRGKRIIDTLEDIMGIDIDNDGVVGRVNANAAEFPVRYSATAKLEAIILAARRVFPRLLNEVDCRGALALHYICQRGGPCSGELLHTLIRLNPYSVFVLDKCGNSPWHLAIGCRNVNIARLLAQWALQNNCFPKLSVPNNSNQLPSELTGESNVRALFKLDSRTDLCYGIFHAILSPTIFALSAYLAWDYSQQQNGLYCGILVAPFVILTLACVGLDVLVGAQLDSGSGNLDIIPTFCRNIQQISFLRRVVLQCCQVRVSLEFFRNVWTGQASSQWLLEAKRIEMVVVLLPLAIFNICCLLDESDSKMFNTGDDGNRRVRSTMQLTSLIVCWIMLTLSGTEHENHRYWRISRAPWLRPCELTASFLFRAAESMTRVSNFALFALYLGPGYLFLAWFLECCFMIVLTGKLLDVIAEPLCKQSLKFILQEVLDLCGTFHALNANRLKGDMSHTSIQSIHLLLGDCGIFDSVLKTTIKLMAQFILLVFTCASLGKSWIPLQQKNVLHASTFVLLVIIGFVAEMLFFFILYSLLQFRKGSLGKKQRLNCWGFPLFQNMSSGFQQDAQHLLMKCSYQAGDYITRRGVQDTPMHFLVQGLISIEEPILSASTPHGNGGRRSGERVASKADEPVASKAERLPMDFDGGCIDDLNRNAKLAFQGVSFGARGLLLGSSCMTDIKARCTCKTLALTRDACRALFTKHPKMIEQFLKNVRKYDIKISWEDLESNILINKEVKNSNSQSDSIDLFHATRNGSVSDADAWVSRAESAEVGGRQNKTSAQKLVLKRFMACLGLSLCEAFQRWHHNVIDARGMSATACIEMDHSWNALVVLMERNDAFSRNSQIWADITSCIQWDISNLLEIPGRNIFISLPLSTKSHFTLTIKDFSLAGKKRGIPAAPATPAALAAPDHPCLKLGVFSPHADCLQQPPAALLERLKTLVSQRGEHATSRLTGEDMREDMTGQVTRGVPQDRRGVASPATSRFTGYFFASKIVNVSILQ